jgi:hypothetical protein
MAVEWYLNQYECERCGYYWEDEWSCTCDDRCPECNLTNSPQESVDLSRELTAEDFVIAAASVEPTIKRFEGPSKISGAEDGVWVTGKIWVPRKTAERQAQRELERR